MITFCKTSTIPEGGVIEVSAICKLKVVGNKNDAETATNDAQKVPMTYKIIIGFIVELDSDFCESAFITKTKTKIGATPFKALTNNLPKTATTGITLGTNNAKIIPITRPMAINFIKAVSP